ncbi:MAG TPA: Gfo/Idh/MocA family oxidoreductase [Vicinamibacterales bacterium]|nr:Gfo/Idh/MocA family oxidoreductase [Vicinamibacterales bacterium]
MIDPVRVAVVGVGHLGRHHARVLAALPGVSLVGVVDTDPGRAAEVASANHTNVIAEVADLAGQVDAVSVAVPTEAHTAVALALIAQGVHVLVEKPLTRSLEEADQMLDAAEAAGVVLAVGHIEHFNPAVHAARPHITQPRFIEVHRLGTFPERSLDIDVVFDLMIHDLGLVLEVVGSDVVGIEAVGVPVLTPRIDIANARLKFANGCIANLTASRISREQVRKIRFFQQSTYLSIDYKAQEVEVWRLVPQEGAAPRIEGGKLDVQRDEPLKRELEDFVGAVRARRAPGVTGAQGRAALVLARDIVSRMSESAGEWKAHR